MEHFISLMKVLWLCLTVYFLVKDAIISYMIFKTFFKTGEMSVNAAAIPNKIAFRVVNVILAVAILILV